MYLKPTRVPLVTFVLLSTLLLLSPIINGGITLRANCTDSGEVVLLNPGWYVAFGICTAKTNAA